MATYDRKIWKLLSLPGPIGTASTTRSGIYTEQVTGMNTRIDTGPPPIADVIEQYGLYEGMPVVTTPKKLRVQSNNIEDDETVTGGGPPRIGTGAWTLRLHGLDGNYDSQTEDIEAKGTQLVLTSKTWTRMHRMEVLTAGSLGYNAGNISVTWQSSPFYLFANLFSVRGSTTMAVYTVPRGFTGYMTGLNVSSVSSQGDRESDTVRVFVHGRKDAGQGGELFKILDSYVLNSSAGFTGNSVEALRFEELTDIKIHVNRTFNDRTTVAANFTMYLIKHGTDI